MDILDQDAKKKIEYRNMTYIPEISDKKHKSSYTYLAPDINSPPLLRTRQRRQPFAGSTAGTRSNSRATTPDRVSVSRQLSNDSESSSKKSSGGSNDPEKLSLESELNDLLKRSDELQNLLSSNKRTVSTRVSILHTT